jgi:uncharacterized protein
MISTQSEQENIDQVRRGYEAFSAGDTKSLNEMLAPNVTWRQAPAGVIAAQYTGRDEVLAFFKFIQAETQGSFKVVPITFAASGDRVFVEEHASGIRKGISFKNEIVQRFTLSDGKIAACVHYTSDYPNWLNAWK